MSGGYLAQGFCPGVFVREYVSVGIFFGGICPRTGVCMSLVVTVWGSVGMFVV